MSHHYVGYVEVVNEMEDVDNDMDDESRGRDFSGSDSDVNEYDYMVCSKVIHADQSFMSPTSYRSELFVFALFFSECSNLSCLVANILLSLCYVEQWKSRYFCCSS